MPLGFPAARRLIFALAIIFVAAADGVAAQESILARARAAPTRIDGLLMLQQHLAEEPRDVDARLLYGLMLSWEKRYEEARAELRKVLAQSPDYLDARVGLMNVEWWSGNLRTAREHVDEILRREPGNPQARRVRQQLDAANRPWTVSVSASHDRFNGSRTPWNEQSLALSHETPAGSVILRASRAARFNRTDELIEVEFYPSFRPGTYAFIGVGAAPDRTLYPRTRLAFDLYQSLGGGFEVSGGYRQLNFDDRTDIYVATLTKYVGNWMVTGKVFHVPKGGPLHSTSGHFVTRRYFGADGTSYVGVGYSRGLSREEVRGFGDLETLDSDALRGGLEVQVTPRLRLELDGATSRQDRVFGSAVRQHTIQAGFSVSF